MRKKSFDKMYEIFEEMFPIYFSQFFNTEEELNFIDSLKANTDLFVFSGILRDFLLQYKNETPRDFDFVVRTINPVTEKLLEKYLVRRTQLGGYKCRINNKNVDIWTLKDTWAIKRNNPLFLQNYLPLTAFFNITAAVYSLNYEKLIIHDKFKNFLEDKKHRKLDIVLPDNPFPALCIIKSFELINKFHIPASDDLKDYIVKYNKVLSWHDYADIQLKHYNTILFDYNTIQDKVRGLQHQSKIENKVRLKDSSISLFDSPEIAHAALSY